MTAGVARRAIAVYLVALRTQIGRKAGAPGAHDVGAEQGGEEYRRRPNCETVLSRLSIERIRSERLARAASTGDSLADLAVHLRRV